MHDFNITWAHRPTPLGFHSLKKVHLQKNTIIVDSNTYLLGFQMCGQWLCSILSPSVIQKLYFLLLFIFVHPTFLHISLIDAFNIDGCYQLYGCVSVTSGNKIVYSKQLQLSFFIFDNLLETKWTWPSYCIYHHDRKIQAVRNGRCICNRSAFIVRQTISDGETIIWISDIKYKVLNLVINIFRHMYKAQSFFKLSTVNLNAEQFITQALN